MTSRLGAHNISAGYGVKPVLDDVSVDIPDGQFTVIVGPNACGKSTLLKTLARIITPTAGEVRLDGRPITDYRPKEVARLLSLLPQSPLTPEGITVEDLVGRGRYAHQGLLGGWTEADDTATARAMAATGVTELRQRLVSALSGGQRQRVWLAMVLAQDAPVVLLDEPTTFLDITHQVEVLNIAAQLHREGRTVVAVLHELTLAFRYASHLIVMKDGQIVAQGHPQEIVSPELLKQVYEIDCELIADPRTGRPIVVPH